MIQIKLVGMSVIITAPNFIFLTFKCNGSWVVSIIENMNFNFQLPSTFIFWFLTKNGLIKSLSFENLSACKIYWSQVDWWNIFIRLGSLNIHYFLMVGATELKVWQLSHLQWRYLPAVFHANLYWLVQKLLRRIQTEQNCDLISFTSLFKESKLKTKMKIYVWADFEHATQVDAPFSDVSNSRIHLFGILRSRGRYVSYFATISSLYRS
jgi:hypothetical protein